MGRPKGSKNKPKNLSPQEEEALARKRARNMEKARAVRMANAHKRNAEIIWTEIKPRLKASTCRCGLKKGMTLDELQALGAGCTDDHDYYTKVLKVSPPWKGMTLAQALENGKAPRPGHVCAVLSAYRRFVEDPHQLKAVEAA